QHQERDLAAAGHHAVVELQHVERTREIEQVDREAEGSSGAEVAAAGPKQAREGLRVLAHGHHEWWKSLPARPRLTPTRTIFISAAWVSAAVTVSAVLDVLTSIWVLPPASM